MTSENRIVVGNAGDLPDKAAQGRNIVVTATPMGDQVATRSRRPKRASVRSAPQAGEE